MFTIYIVKPSYPPKQVYYIFVQSELVFYITGSLYVPVDDIHMECYS